MLLATMLLLVAVALLISGGIAYVALQMKANTASAQAAVYYSATEAGANCETGYHELNPDDYVSEFVCEDDSRYPGLPYSD